MPPAEPVIDVAGLVEHDLRALTNAVDVTRSGVGRIQRKQPGRHVRTGQHQRIGRAARSVAAEVGYRRKVAGKVHRHRVKTRRRAVAVRLRPNRPRLVQHNRRRNRIGHNRIRTVVLDLEHAGAQIDRRRVNVAVGIGHRLHQRQQVGVRQCQRRGVVVAGGAGVPDVVELRERHLTGRRVQRDREVVGAARRTGDDVAGLVEHDLRALANAVEVARVVSAASSANSPDATFEPVSTSE